MLKLCSLLGSEVAAKHRRGRKPRERHVSPLDFTLCSGSACPPITLLCYRSRYICAKALGIWPTFGRVPSTLGFVFCLASRYELWLTSVIQPVSKEETTSGVPVEEYEVRYHQL